MPSPGSDHGLLVPATGANQRKGRVGKLALLVLGCSSVNRTVILKALSHGFYPQHHKYQVWWLTPVTPALVRWRQEEAEVPGCSQLHNKLRPVCAT